MKVKALIASLALMGNAMAQTTTSFETPEYQLSKVLKSINASYAYSRGYTGKGSVIAVLDTGIDTSNNQFKDKILFIQDFSGSGTPLDRVGHGTHVAGIAAAARDGIGVQGVAYDAKLIIGKISDNGSILPNNLLAGVAWANQTGADVANMSVGWQMSTSYLSAKLMSPGLYTTKFTNTGSLPIGSLFSPTAWAQATQGEMVLVMAAGNDSTKWSQGLAGLATATDSKGNLLLGGRVLIAGNWDPTNNAANITSNGAAHLCQNTVSGVMGTLYCADKYKTWDFYLMAPGTSIVSTVPKTSGIAQIIDRGTMQPTGLAYMTGTSMAAPAVAGGVAILHQMWPQMKGSNLVRLLLVTANKDIPNYNLYVHGQGLMDLDKATRPYGATGIPTTGRLSGPNLANVRPLVYTGGSASTGGLTGLMVVDEFERDFYMDSKVLTAHKIKTQFNLNQLLMAYDTKNAYTLFNNYTHRVNGKAGNFEFAVYKDLTDPINASPSMIEFGYTKSYDNMSVKLTGGFFNEQNTWLGNSIGSFVGDGNNTASHTYFTNIGINKVVDNTNFYATYATGFTKTNANSANITSIGTVYSNTWTVGSEYISGHNTYGLMIYKPVTVYKAMADVVAPVGLDSDFNVIQNSKANLAAQTKEMRLGFYHKFEDKKEYQSMAFIESRFNYHGQEGMRDTAVGVKFTKWFN